MKLIKKLKKRKKLLLIIVSLLILAIGTFIYYQRNQPPTSSTPTDTSLSPATDAEKQATEAHKDQLSQPGNSSGSSSTAKTLSVVITEATNSGVRGYVQGIFEEGGTCMATATQGSQTITKTSTGFENVSYTQCAPINWDNPLGSGSWAITLAYKSANGQGTSSKTIEVN